MKKFLLLLIAVIGLGSAQAQISNEEFELVRSIFNSERKVLFAQNMELSTQQAELFWPVYEAYEKEKAPMGNARVKLVKQLVDDADKLTDDKIDALYKESFALTMKRMKLRRKYYKIIKKQVNTEVAARFLQLDEYVNTAITAQLLDGIPLVGVKKD